MATATQKQYENQLPAKSNIISGDKIRVIGKDNKSYTLPVELLRTWIISDIDIDAGLSDAARTALLNCFKNVAWANGSGQSYYNALERAL